MTKRISKIAKERSAALRLAAALPSVTAAREKREAIEADAKKPAIDSRTLLPELKWGAV